MVKCNNHQYEIHYYYPQLHVDNVRPCLAYVPFFRLIVMLSGSSFGELTVKLVLYRSDVPSTNIAFCSTRIPQNTAIWMSPGRGIQNDPACPTGQLPHHFLYLLLVPLSCNHKITFTCLRLLTLAYTPVAVCCCGWSHRTIEGPHGRHIRPRHAAKVCSSRYLKRHQWQKITACNLP